MIDLAHIWYTPRKENKGTYVAPITRDCFKETFLDTFFTTMLREVKDQEFMKLRQGNVMVKIMGSSLPNSLVMLLHGC